MMDFVERLFGISPDAGSGAFELLLFVLPVLIVGLLWLRRQRTKQRT